MATYFNIGDAAYETPVFTVEELLENGLLDGDTLFTEFPIENFRVKIYAPTRILGDSITIYDREQEFGMNFIKAEEKQEFLYHVRTRREGSPSLLTIKDTMYIDHRGIPCFSHTIDDEFSELYRATVYAILHATLAQKPSMTLVTNRRGTVLKVIFAEPHREMVLKFWEAALNSIFPLITEIEKPLNLRAFRKPGFYYRATTMQLDGDSLGNNLRPPSAHYEHGKLSLSSYRQISGLRQTSAFDDFFELVERYEGNDTFYEAEDQWTRISEELGFKYPMTQDDKLVHDVLSFFYYFYDEEAV